MLLDESTAYRNASTGVVSIELLAVCFPVALENLQTIGALLFNRFGVDWSFVMNHVRIQCLAVMNSSRHLLEMQAAGRTFYSMGINKEGANRIFIHAVMEVFGNR